MVFKHKDIGPELSRTEWEAVDAHEGVLSVSQIPITSIWLKGLFASRPAASVEGRHYWATDTDEIWRDTGSAWEQVMESVALKAGDYPTAYVGISASATGRAANLDKLLVSGIVITPTAGGADLVPPDNRVITMFGGDDAAIGLRYATYTLKSAEGTDLINGTVNAYLVVTMACDGSNIKIHNGAGEQKQLVYAYFEEA